MPPLRTASAVKSIKTERSHEENQERAYVAASRRSDRSLEARVVSAQRASGIHKRRTGRPLRVTEADVINEEMYEEEDYDFSVQHRRLTAHLQTQNAEFDRRLTIHLANHVTMRSALAQAVLNCWQEDHLDNTLQIREPDMIHSTPQMMSASPTNDRETAYPVANAQGQQAGQREHWVLTETQQNHLASDSPQTPTPESSKLASNEGSTARGVFCCSPATSVVSQHNYFQQPALGFRDQPGTSCQSPPSSCLDRIASNQTFTNPLSTTLPVEVQQLLTSNPLDFSCNDATHSMIASQDTSPAYSYKPNGGSNSMIKSAAHHSGMLQVSQGGIGQTLALPVLDKDTNLNYPPVCAKHSTVLSNARSVYGGKILNHGFAFDPLRERIGGACITGTFTSSEIDWNSFLSVTALEEELVAQADGIVPGPRPGKAA